MGSSVVRRNVVIPDELDKRFRMAVLEEKGLEKGDLSEAMCEAMELWIKTRKRK